MKHIVTLQGTVKMKDIFKVAIEMNIWKFLLYSSAIYFFGILVGLDIARRMCNC